MAAVQRWLFYLAVGFKAEVNVPLELDKWNWVDIGHMRWAGIAQSV